MAQLSDLIMGLPGGRQRLVSRGGVNDEVAPLRGDAAGRP